jgi:hypothetical protein
MKTKAQTGSGIGPRASESGVAVIVMLVLTAILLTFVAVDVASLRQLRQELRLVDREQLLRLQRASVPTNTVQGAEAPSINSAAPALQP